jgi:hypothetical protein
MTNTISVGAQWALEGKRSDGEGYRILACSTGDLDRANFADAISRFQVGELSNLPQVSVSWARLGTQPALSYIAFAIHWYATDGKCHADDVTERDSQGRPIAYTSYFSLPYKRLAEAAIGYLAMYEALSAIRLSATDGPLKEVPIAVPASRTPVADDLAVRVAPLLLTGRPVCVLGAEDTSMLERLGFIDAVMELLPYGFRSRMTAATFTRATNRNHRFRLFFSSAPRAHEPDHVVMWGDEPSSVPFPDGEAGDYLDWLQENIGPLARLTELRTELGFGPKDTLQALESVLGTRHRLHHRPPLVRRISHDRPRQRPSQPPTLQNDAGEDILVSCARSLKMSNLTRLRSDLLYLKKIAESKISETRRARYREQITRLGLLRHNFPVHDKFQEKLYDALIKMAFPTPLNYLAYCRVEKCAGITPGDPPHEELLAAIVRAGMAEPVGSAIVYWHLRDTDEKKLSKWLASGQVDPVDLIDFLARDRTFPQHARIICDVILEYLRKRPKGYDSHQFRLALARHGFLAAELQQRHPDEFQYQVDVLYQLLRAAYPQIVTAPEQDLSRRAVLDILSGADAPPTSALFSAVLLLLQRPQSWELAWHAYIHSALTSPNLDEATRVLLRDRLPSIDLATADTVESRAVTDPPRWGWDSR